MNSSAENNHYSMKLVRASMLDPVAGENKHHFREREGNSFQVKKAGGYNVK